MAFKTLDDADLAGKRALVRVDINVPMAEGKVTDDTRLRAILPTIAKLRAGGAKVVLLAHFDRPKGKVVPEMSLKPLAQPLADLLDAPVAFASDSVGEAAKAAVDGLKNGDVLLLENVRFHPGEEKNDPEFAKALAANGDLYVNDAFSAAHRAHASTEGLARLLPAYAGEQMRLELTALDKALGNPERPVIGIVGGSKVSTKLDLLRNLVTRLDKLAIGGGMANTFLYAQGHDVGASYCEKELAETAREIIRLAGQNNCKLFLPVDIVVAEKMAPGAPARVRGLGAVDEDERILDAGPETVERLCRAMANSKTLIWNGPLGVFEIPPFDKGTMTAAHYAAQLAKDGKLVAVAGGGDTVAALNAAGCADDFTFVSTAGGAFLEWMEGKELPGVAALTA
ncbi:phosphoglycerate kinase [Phenylobacterium sp. Root77]|jgi:phosphoglycerate kinase|uniref:phosphoglycerate kinase n=1 Tax=unclassified Phenylobacterium TaxID=2640670 RepID=UPI0007019670|nr:MULTISPECIES: phosphoglycerate kinase [unclassified Phenylobacterium]KQW73442.1 phosphoglycerate kinase [Phenylobacterium sp. Root1277]KQW92661.1 phosphoglycerate kinase [Phenylobacterium sp. Root1290]KRC40888.1 phosphoglycerate kinase [Phenylobacterium sp. Root77]